MLTADEIERLQDAAVWLLDPVTEYLLQDIARRISEAGQLTATASYEVWRAQQLGLSQKEIKKRLKSMLKVTEGELEKLLTQAADTGYNFDLSHLPHENAVAFRDNWTVRQIVSTAVELAGSDLTNLTQSLGMIDPFGNALPLQEVYRSCCDYAFTQVSTGAMDYNTAIRRATKNLADKGIQTINYESGTHTSVEAAVRRSVFGALGLMQEQISQNIHDTTGCDGWEISAHAASAPDHEPIQGKQYSDAEYTALNNSLVRRIGTLNCGHAAHPIILGVSKPQYTPEELEQLRQENEKGIEYQGKHYSSYEATQLQRRLERTMRKQKRKILVDEASGDEEKLTQDRIRLNATREEYRRFSKAAGLRTQNERHQVTGYGYQRANAEIRTAKQAHTEMLRSIGAESTDLKSLEKYRDAAYNNTQEYRMLSGYQRAVEKHDISPLVGFEQYRKVGADIQNRMVGVTTSTGVRIESYATHFVDRVIGQTSTPHEGMRLGVSIDDALDALQNPVRLVATRTMADGDTRQTFYSEKAAVTISSRDKRLIQTNPWKRGGK